MDRWKTNSEWYLSLRVNILLSRPGGSFQFSREKHVDTAAVDGLNLDCMFLNSDNVHSTKHPFSNIFKKEAS
jgi:hypothetical protein